MTQRHPEVARDAARSLPRARVAAADRALPASRRDGALAAADPPQRDRRASRALGLPNYWGYNTLGFFAPDARFASGGDGRAGGRVQADGEGAAPRRDRGAARRRVQPHAGRASRRARRFRCAASTTRPTTGSPRGIARRVPRLQRLRQQPRHRATRACSSSCSIRCATGSPSITSTASASISRRCSRAIRSPSSASRRFFEIVRQDPVLAPVKLDRGAVGPRRRTATSSAPSRSAGPSGTTAIATPCAAAGAATPGLLPELATRLTGSSDVFDAAPRAAREHQLRRLPRRHDARRIWSAYSHKHNEANGEHGRDGPHDDSHNWGVEGPSRDARVRKRRERARRSLLATLALSQGVPMLSHGDEIGRTQRGNNNAYCQDNETTWVDWSSDAPGRGVPRLRAARVRAAARQRGVPPPPLPAERRRGRRPGIGVRWLRPDGVEARRGRLAGRNAPSRRAVDAGERSPKAWTKRGASADRGDGAAAAQPGRAVATSSICPSRDAASWHELLNTAVRRHAPARRRLDRASRPARSCCSRSGRPGERRASGAARPRRTPRDRRRLLRDRRHRAAHFGRDARGARGGRWASTRPTEAGAARAIAALDAGGRGRARRAGARVARVRRARARACRSRSRASRTRSTGKSRHASRTAACCAATGRFDAGAGALSCVLPERSARRVITISSCASPAAASRARAGSDS